MLTNIMSVLREEEGATLVEYSLVVALIAIACIVATKALGTSIQGVFTSITNSLKAA